MIDMPQAAPPAYEQVIIEKLTDCGLRDGSFTVRYEDELQSVEIVIEERAAASPAQFDCIRRAAGTEIVTFTQADLQRAYSDYVSERVRPQVLADARAELAKHGALDGFPERRDFASDLLFAEAVEQQCGVKPGSFFAVSRFGLSVQPNATLSSKISDGRIRCLFAAINYTIVRGEGVKFGFVGNEAVAPEK